MPKLAANLTTLFTDVPFLDRFERAARAGFEAVEFLFPYAHTVDEIGTRLEDHSLDLVLMNMPPGDWDAGERGMAGLPGRDDEFRRSVDTALRYARDLKCPNVHCMSGMRDESIALDAQLVVLVNNLTFAADACAADGITMLLEPLNSRDVPGYLVSTTTQALDLIDLMGRPNTGLQFDVYHVQIMEGDLAPRLERLLDRIPHIQISDTPGRHEPGTGEINYPFLLSHLDRIGYRGYVGCEYNPASTTEAGLGWATTYLNSD
ncbi:MAG: 2-oxo-tetronate isomerase [Pseudomonadota bacterium]